MTLKEGKLSYLVYNENKEEIANMKGYKHHQIAKKVATRYGKEATKDKPLTVFIRKAGTKTMKEYVVWTEQVKNTYFTEFRKNEMMTKGFCKYIPIKTKKLQSD